MPGVVIWNEDGLNEIWLLAGEFADAKCQEVVDVANPPIDTGFLANSGYINSSRDSTFDRTWESGQYSSRHTRRAREGEEGDDEGRIQRSVNRERVESPEPPPDETGVTIGWAAIYAWFVEDSQPFAYPALLSVAEDEE